MVRGIYSLIEQRSECDVELLEWMMFDSDIFKVYVLSTYSAKNGTGLLTVICFLSRNCKTGSG